METEAAHPLDTPDIFELYIDLAWSRYPLTDPENIAKIFYDILGLDGKYVVSKVLRAHIGHLLTGEEGPIADKAGGNFIEFFARGMAAYEYGNRRLSLFYGEMMIPEGSKRLTRHWTLDLDPLNPEGKKTISTRPDNREKTITA
jgi:hypothetical protein